VKRSPSALWSIIDSTVADVVQACRRARAAEELLVKRRREEDAAMSIGDIIEDDPKPAYDENMHPRLVNVEDLVQDLAFQKKYPNGADLVELKAEIRKKLHLLKNALSSTYTEEETHTILFPLVVYFDELARFASSEVARNWENFQGEIYSTSNGGEEFFTYLEQTKSPQLAVEVYYFCLVDGFEGKYADDPARIEDYKKELISRIEVAPIAVEPPKPDSPSPELVAFPYQYYAIAGGAVVGIYLLLRAWGASY